MTEVTAPSPTAGRRVLVVVGNGLLAASVTGLVFYFVSWRQSVAIAIAASSSYLMVLAPLSAVLLLIAHRYLPAVGAVLVTAAGLGIALPSHFDVPSRPNGPSIVVLTVNLRLGQADPHRILSLVRRYKVDVLLVQELTSAAQDGFRAAGLPDELPHSFAESRDGAGGVGLWSRFPLVETEHHAGLHFAAASARLQLPDGQPGPTFLTTHLPAPWPQPAGGWLTDVKRLPILLSSLATRSGGERSAVVVGGDFNATLGNAQFRKVLRGGYSDATEKSGSGPTPTYPADSFIPPFLGIDHVLVRDAVPSRPITVSIDGSDHRGLLVRVGLSDG